MGKRKWYDMREFLAFPIRPIRIRSVIHSVSKNSEEPFR